MENQILTLGQALTLFCVAVAVVGLLVISRRRYSRVLSKIARFRQRGEVIPPGLQKWEKFYGRLSLLGELGALIFAVLLVGAGFFLEW
jgi:hypothetical protein